MIRDRRNRWLGVAVGWTIVMIIGSSVPSSVRTVPLFAYDKILHLIEYATFSILWGAYLRAVLRIRGWKAVAFVVLLCSAYGALDELYQGQVGRSRDPNDWLADTVGGVLGQCLFVGAMRCPRKKNDTPLPH